MAAFSARGPLLVALFGACLALLAGCAAPAASPYASGASLNGAGEPVDAVTGLPLPGVGQSGGGGGGM